MKAFLLAGIIILVSIAISFIVIRLQSSEIPDDITTGGEEIPQIEDEPDQITLTEPGTMPEVQGAIEQPPQVVPPEHTTTTPSSTVTP